MLSNVSKPKVNNNMIKNCNIYEGVGLTNADFINNRFTEQVISIPINLFRRFEGNEVVFNKEGGASRFSNFPRL